MNVQQFGPADIARMIALGQQLGTAVMAGPWN